MSLFVVLSSHVVIGGKVITCHHYSFVIRYRYISLFLCNFVRFIICCLVALNNDQVIICCQKKKNFCVQKIIFYWLISFNIPKNFVLAKNQKIITQVIQANNLMKIKFRNVEIFCCRKYQMWILLLILLNKSLTLFITHLYSVIFSKHLHWKPVQVNTIWILQEIKPE